MQGVCSPYSKLVCFTPTHTKLAKQLQLYTLLIAGINRVNINDSWTVEHSAWSQVWPTIPQEIIPALFEVKNLYLLYANCLCYDGNGDKGEKGKGRGEKGWVTGKQRKKGHGVIIKQVRVRVPVTEFCRSLCNMLMWDLEGWHGTV